MTREKEREAGVNKEEMTLVQYAGGKVTRGEEQRASLYWWLQGRWMKYKKGKGGLV
jgi:hypothetical protein